MCRDHELNLEALLADPLVRLVMSSDSVEEDDIRRLFRPREARSFEPAGPRRSAQPEALQL